MASYTPHTIVTLRNSRTERIDEISIHTNDIKQDAALRLVKSYQRNGTPLPNDKESIVSALSANISHIGQTLKHSVIDEQRKQKRRAVSLERHFAEAEQIVDERTEDEMNAVESTAKDELDAFVSSATSAELEALSLMKHCQQLINSNQQLPNSVRSKLKRLRKETGLALDVSLL